ncbi:hypothetical protein NUU61_005061 [Penicillium alfredii]|uniref:Protein kinase domain-containing protein n=1 Tax=Penicillium alfredii TaxID=1506179 RepID=A0A9W9F8P3_9EURO|nr:uncharacterized protein NUU61_005061 [Penicillium alfredii]KAJ5095705.1 hypothetical protein NUU61_005061 [Penicillium alfredii]
MRFLNRLVPALLSLNAFLIPLISSAPTRNPFDRASLDERGYEVLSGQTARPLQDTDAVADSFSSLAPRAPWEIGKRYKEYLDAHPAAELPIPRDTPEGKMALRSLSGRKIYWDHKKGEQWTVVMDWDRKLGQGGFGTVYMAQLYKSKSTSGESETVAVKKSNEKFGRVMTGAKLQMSINDRNVLKVIDRWVIFDKKKPQFAYMVMPRASGGDLTDKMLDPSWDQSKIDKAIMKATSGLMNLHEKGIWHRDIKDGNILLDGNEPKIADFDFAIQMAQGAKSNDFRGGTAGYRAPEFLKLTEYTEKIDVFAMGMTWLRMSVPGLRNRLALEAIWRSFINPRNGHEWLLPEDIKGILEEKFPCLSPEMVEILSEDVPQSPGRSNAVFISGPHDTGSNQAYFHTYYTLRIDHAISRNYNFVIGPLPYGVDSDALAYLLIRSVSPRKITIFLTPAEHEAWGNKFHALGVNTHQVEGESAIDRDAAMTRASLYDILRVRTHGEAQEQYGKLWERGYVTNTERNWKRRRDIPENKAVCPEEINFTMGFASDYDYDDSDSRQEQVKTGCFTRPVAKIVLVKQYIGRLVAMG